MTDIFATEREAITAYEHRLKCHRDRFASRPSVAAITNGEALPGDLLRLFMIHYAAFGISMTHPVEDWIRRAGIKCCDLKYEVLGEALVKHASHEAGHHRLMVSDLWTLVDKWNAEHPERIDPIALSRLNLPSSVNRYRRLHEKVIDSAAPYTQIALEYEIEGLSVRHGPHLLAATKKAGALGGFSFLEDHVALDIAHTQFNRKQIAELLVGHPECIEPLVETGAAALEIYGQFIDDCIAATVAFGTGIADDFISCQLMRPPGFSGEKIPEWLKQVRSIRSHILFDGGVRPAFGPRGSAYGDPDLLDFHCYHFLLRDHEVTVGAGRLTQPGIINAPSLVDTAFGRSNIQKILSQVGIKRETCAEASRLVVLPEHRNGFNPRILFAGLWALAVEFFSRFRQL